MDFASHEDEMMDEEINDQHKEMSDEDYALSNDSCFDNDMENDNDTIGVIYWDLNRTQVNTLRPVKKMCALNSITLMVMKDTHHAS